MNEQRPLELWAGAECTINRVGDRYYDQSVRTGHRARAEDIDRLAALGVRRVRFPVLWEAVAPDSLERMDFGWHDAQLERLRAHGIEPIIGLLHHGSGPRYAPFDSPLFVPAFARFAEAVARRYPWARSFTPINEPLTTARFASLYGHWYPHGRSTATFLQLLLNEIEATRAAMRAIRAVTPAAELVQTEDGGRTFGTPRLAAQCRYENERRWLTFDLLCGRVDREHWLRGHLEHEGIDPARLDALVAEPCPPDVLGLNYYVTSDRFLDERLARYPRATHGGNAFLAYADVEAVRVRGEGITSHDELLLQAWRRYGLPLAITEVHLDCSRDEQLRWLAGAWRGALTARAQGADVRAVTLWSAFGAVDWSSLLTRERGHYEPGAYDVRFTPPRPTALCTLARALAEDRPLVHPALAGPGWWQRSQRLVYPVHGRLPRAVRSASKPVLLAVGTGPLRGALVRQAAQRGLRALCVPSLAAALRAFGARTPWLVLVELDEHAATSELESLIAVARGCERARAGLVLFSSDRVFDGRASVPYTERDATSPACARGALQHAAERALEPFGDPLIVRTGPLLDPAHARCALASRRDGALEDDEVVSPTYVPHAIASALDLAIDGERGVWHLASDGHASWREIVRRVFGETALRSVRAAPARMRALASQRARLMPSLDAALEAYTAALPQRALVARSGS